MGALEESIVGSILGYLKTVPGVWTLKVHGGPHQRMGIPDIVGTWHGRFFAIEVKRPGEKPTPIQSRKMRDIKAAGGLVFAAWSVNDVRQRIGADLDNGYGSSPPP